MRRPAQGLAAIASQLRQRYNRQAKLKGNRSLLYPTALGEPPLRQSYPTMTAAGNCAEDQALALRLSLELNKEFQCDSDAYHPNDDDYALALSMSMSSGDPQTETIDRDFALALSLSSGRPPVTEEEDDDTVIAHLVQHNEDDQRSAESLPTPFHTLSGSFGGDNTVTIQGVLYREQDCGSAYGPHTSLCFYMAFCAGDGERALAVKALVASAANAIRARLRPDIAVQFDGPSAMADTEVFMAAVQLTHTPICVASRHAGTILMYTDPAVAQPPVRLHLRNNHFTLLMPA